MKESALQEERRQYRGDEDIRSICEIQDATRWIRIRRRASRDHVNRMDDNRLAGISKNGKPNT